MNFKIRKAMDKDVKNIAYLWRQLWANQMQKDDYYKGQISQNAGQGQMQEAIHDDNCQIFIAEDTDGNVVGFVEVWKYQSDFYFCVDDYGYILHYYIEEDVRDYRLVLGLYRAAELWAKEKGLKYISADVLYHNNRVKTLLEKMGLSTYKTRMVKQII